MLDPDLLIGAFLRVTLNGDVSQHVFIRAAVDQLRIFRALVAGESVSIGCTVCLAQNFRAGRSRRHGDLSAARPLTNASYGPIPESRARRRSSSRLSWT